MKKNIFFTGAGCVVVILAILFAGATDRAFAAGTESQGAMGQTQSMSKDIVRADKLIGKTAKDQQGNDLGEIKDLVVDQSGRAAYLILSSSETAGKLVPVPYSQAGISMQQDEIILQNIDQAKLQNAPAFTEDEWQKLSRSDFEQEVRGYFGTQSGRVPGVTTSPTSDTYNKEPGEPFLDDPSSYSPGSPGASGSGRSVDSDRRINEGGDMTGAGGAEGGAGGGM